ncbi:GNAT family N-acetyltransferase [Veronia nyctiphanis]|uniref:GNAT family N-acetyltransferase n=1 Tax=Veronia nyctiphanis TaxID=1278244 RepID=A0A4Q0YXR5_9GAMM|nr:N-acetyltransferase [Veronia nyctiphanis]RXJ73861.1 GNAT family N-acetyltransferase [Veronia nyctiphanis]
MLIRTEVPADILQIDRMLRQVFDTDAEAKLVMALRENGNNTLSLVACTDNGEIVGHIMFSPVMLEGEDLGWQALSPVSVLPGHQKKGIATKLINEGFEMLFELGYPACFVLGSPEFYGRFGFATAAKVGLSCQWPVPDTAFMAVELEPGSFSGKFGQISYCPEFAQF